MMNCKVCDEDKFWYVRNRVPFYGNLNGDWGGEQYERCVPQRMRYQYSLNGTIGINDNPPSDQGNPANAHSSFGEDGQIYAPLHNERSDIFGETRGSQVVWSKALLDFLIDEVANGKDISCVAYPESALDVGWALKLLGAGMDDSLLVGAGSISPWVKAVALHSNVGQVVTVDYNAPYCDNCHPRLKTVDMDTLMRRSTPAGYSFIVSYSSIEHDGLGRYGYPMDPYGDEHAMNEFWNLLKIDRRNAETFRWALATSVLWLHSWQDPSNLTDSAWNLMHAPPFLLILLTSHDALACSSTKKPKCKVL